MRYLILSDLHANWEALEAVLRDAGGEYDRIVCCGDIVGYGADPNRVTDWVRGNVPVVVRGNHDRACVGLEDLQWFNPVARRAAEWTQKELTPDNLQYLRDLERGPRDVNGMTLVHGSPADEDEYVITANDASQLWAYLPSPITFFGHTHLQGGFQFIRKKVRKILKETTLRETITVDPDGWYLVNPGSVGQPRDGNATAAWALYDSSERSLIYRRSSYDIARAQSKITAAGLPAMLALRLAKGE